jgi:hypothetical protein
MLYEEANKRQANFSCYPEEHTLLSLTVALTPQRSSGSRPGGSDNPAYVAHGLALRNEVKCERGVWYEKGAVTKKVVFSPTNIASRKRAFNPCNFSKPLLSVRRNRFR